jgi:hypothetical protein
MTPGSNLSDLRDLLLTAEEEVLGAWEVPGGEPKETLTANSTAKTMLDRIAQTGVVSAENHAYQELELVVDTFVRLFRAAGEARSPTVMVTPIASEQQALRWYDIATRAYVTGALSVSVKAYGGIRCLVLQQPNEMRRGRLWFRDTVTALARLKLFKKKSLIGPMSEYVSERPVFFRRFRSNKDEVVNQLCRFDFLQCVVSVAETEDLHACYPNFGGFYKERTEPIVVDLVTHGKSREVIPNVTDETLAEVILELDRLTAEQFFSYAGWDAGHWSDPRIPDFLRKYGG